MFKIVNKNLNDILHTRLIGSKKSHSVKERIAFPNDVEIVSLNATTANKKVNKVMENGTRDGDTGIPISFNVKYNIAEASSGQSLLLKINTTQGKKVVVHSATNANINYQTTIFYIENNTLNIVEQTFRLFDNYDVDSFIALGGIYYIQFDFTGGTGDFSFLAAELSNYSSAEPCDNFIDALYLTPVSTISANDFFDNYIDYDYYAFNNTTAGQTVYVNFKYDNYNIMNPLKHNPSIILNVFYLSNTEIEVVYSESVSPACLDIPIELDNVGTYYFAVAPNESLPFGQLQEYYNFSVNTSMQNPTTLPSNTSYTIDLSNIEGSIDDGTYNLNVYSSVSPFWVNGTAVRLTGIVNNWNDTPKQIRVRVSDNYNSAPKYGMAYIDASGHFEAVIPLFKTTARYNSFEYGNETMDWNWIDFIDNNGSNMSISFNRINSNWPNHLKIGVCYNDFPLTR